LLNDSKKIDEYNSNGFQQEIDYNLHLKFSTEILLNWNVVHGFNLQLSSLFLL
ncbi:10282_t:CDS:1, partial [Dentiscutata erythropus]